MTPAPPTTESIWTDLSDDLRQFIRRRVSDPHVAEDLLQETFLRIHRGIDALSDLDRLGAWVYRIARNVIYDHYRTSGRTAPIGDADPVEDGAGLAVTQCGHAEEWLGGLVAGLPAAYKDAVRLAEFEGVSQREVADRLGLSLSGAKSRIQRGRAILKDELERCCRFEFDRRGNLLEMEPKGECPVCREGADHCSAPASADGASSR